MLLPPLNILAINNASFIPSPMTVHNLSGGSGLAIDTPTGLVYLVKEEDGVVRVLSSRLAKRDYTVSVGELSNVDALLNLMFLSVDTALQPEDVFGLANGLLESLRWRASEGLIHDPLERRTYLVNALADPEGFISKVQLIPSVQEDDPLVNPDDVDDALADSSITLTPVSVPTPSTGSAVSAVIANDATNAVGELII